jgi:membrane protease subunit HflC
MKAKWLLLILILLAVGAYRSLVFVDETEAVIVTQFGKPISTHVDPGLHFKWPYQSAIRIDRRLQIYDPRPSEFLAAEKKNVDLAVCVYWNVDDPEKFLVTVNDPAGAEARLHDVIWAELAAEVGRSPLEALVSVDPQLHRLDQIVSAVTAKCAERARSAFGIQIVDVQFKRISLPAQVRDSVFQRMRTERAKIARQYRAEGEEEAMKIRAQADKERTVTLAKAYAEAETLRGQAEAKATQIYAEAHQKDPAFYELLRTLEAYKQFLDDKTTVLLSADSDLLKYLTGKAAPQPPAAKTKDLAQDPPAIQPAARPARAKTEVH